LSDWNQHLPHPSRWQHPETPLTKAKPGKTCVPSSHPSTTSKSSSPFPSDFIIFSQNAHHSNTTVHAILSIASSMRPPADLILIQEPYYAHIRVNPKMAQGNPISDVFGCPKHKDWQAIIPPLSASDTHLDVIAYVPSHRSSWTFQARANIISHQSLLCLEINSSSHPFLVFNIYNDVDNGACDTIATLPNSLDRHWGQGVTYPAGPL